MPALVAPFTFGATIAVCRDVDTVKLDVDRGWDDTSHRVFRLDGCNGWEDSTGAGLWASAELRDVMYPGRFVLVASLKPGRDFPADKYGGRWLARITTEGGDLTEALLRAGLVAPWNGRGPKPVPPWPIPPGTPRLRDLIPTPAR